MRRTRNVVIQHTQTHQCPSAKMWGMLSSDRQSRWSFHSNYNLHLVYCISGKHTFWERQGWTSGYWSFLNQLPWNLTTVDSGTVSGCKFRILVKFQLWHFSERCLVSLVPNLNIILYFTKLYFVYKCMLLLLRQLWLCFTLFFITHSCNKKCIPYFS